MTKAQVMELVNEFRIPRDIMWQALFDNCLIETPPLRKSSASEENSHSSAVMGIPYSPTIK